jgi:hypothetical protein
VLGRLQACLLLHLLMRHPLLLPRRLRCCLLLLLHRPLLLWLHLYLCLLLSPLLLRLRRLVTLVSGLPSWTSIRLCRSGECSCATLRGALLPCCCS